MSTAETSGSTERSQFESKASAHRQPLWWDSRSPLFPGVPTSRLAPPQSLTGYQGSFAPHRLGHVAMLGTFWVVTLAGGVLWASDGWRPLLNGLQCPGWPQDREWSSSNVNSAQAENPALDPSHVPSVLCSDLPWLPPRTEDSQVLTAATRPCRGPSPPRAPSPPRPPSVGSRTPTPHSEPPCHPPPSLSNVTSSGRTP